MCVRDALKREDGGFAKVKTKRKNLEKRREKSKHAARERRSNETEIFSQLAHELPFQHKICSALDKSSVMRIAIGYLKAKNFLSHKDEYSFKASKDFADDVYLKALDGFLMILTDEGMIVYLSETVFKYLGIKQVDMIGQSIYEYAHPCDHAEIREEIEDKNSSISITKALMEKNHQLSIRLKSTIGLSGKSVNIKSAGYKVIQLSGHSKLIQSEVGADGFRGEPVRFFVLIGQPIAHPSNLDLSLDSKSFLTQHNLDMTFTYCDDRITELLGYQPEELLGKSVYDFYHGLDLADLKKTYHKLYACGQAATDQYRFLAREGGYAWLKTEATVITNKDKPVSIVCVNYVISRIEAREQILSADQKEIQITMYDTKFTAADAYSTDKAYLPEDSQDDSQDELEWTPVGNTELVFTDIDYNKDGCGSEQRDFSSQLSTQTFLNQEDTLDLDYLAPTAGDAMIPLDIPTIEELCSGGEQDLSLFADLWSLTPGDMTPTASLQVPSQKIKREKFPHIKLNDFVEGSSKLTKANCDTTNGQNKEPTKTPFKPYSAFINDLGPETDFEPGQLLKNEVDNDNVPGRVQLGKHNASFSSDWQCCDEPPDKRMCATPQQNSATQEGNSDLIKQLLGDFYQKNMPAKCSDDNVIMPLASLTEQDTEVNAPVKFNQLLQGQELVEILEQSAF